MKKIFLAMAAVAMAFTSCSNEELETVAQNEVKVNICVEVEGQTRAVKSAWVPEDRIFINNSNFNDDHYLTFDGTNWTPSEAFSEMTAEKWNTFYTEASWGAAWTSWKEAGRKDEKETFITLSSMDENGQEVLVSKTGSEVSFDPGTLTWTVKLVMGQPEGFCKITVDGLSDIKYHMQVTNGNSTANMSFNNAFDVRTSATALPAREYYYKNGTWDYKTSGFFAGKGYLEEGNMCYFFKKAGNTNPKDTTYFVLVDSHVIDSSSKKDRIFSKMVKKRMPWETGKGVKIKGPVDLDMNVSKGWGEADANGWVRVQ